MFQNRLNPGEPALALSDLQPQVVWIRVFLQLVTIFQR